ncbi:MAG: vanadium-dependent haloperoxidase [Methylococcaceae bacterium]|nr:vanadium-dependent haloperoxidase [Methylococcaceae bacterium]
MTEYRIEESLSFRISSAKKAADRVHSVHETNGDEQRYGPTNYAMSFTKGLDHEANTGLIKDSNDFVSFRAAIDEGYVDAFTTSVRSSPQKQRQWEAPTAGLVYDLQGPDSQAVTMAPAPALGSTELAYEMAEVYELALLRDVPLTAFSADVANPDINAAIINLNAIGYDITGTNGRPRKHNGTGNVNAQVLFRGSSPGVEIGPYLSQFMLLGTADQTGTTSITDGKITYGALQIDQRVPVAHPINYMMDWNEWLAVQNGADTQDDSALFDATAPRRFITFPRDLATYVHYDALYESYLNACLILLEMGTPTDQGFAKLSGQGRLFLNALDPESNFLTNRYETHEREAGGFALWGGPHILTLVTEVATRALKAVRYQKFNNHCRLRPEALAARIEKATDIENTYPAVNGAFSTLTGTIQDTVNAIIANNSTTNTALLPMAFQEGSPMHPSYGAGHATVAGACVTMLKAYFDTSAVLVDRGGEVKFDRYQNGDTAIEFTPDATGAALVPSAGNDFLTLEGELNKLAANISIGRNMAGVHYFSDYYDSLRMGEEIALGILEEQALGYKTDPFVLTVQTFDGRVRQIGKR